MPWKADILASFTSILVFICHPFCFDPHNDPRPICICVFGAHACSTSLCPVYPCRPCSTSPSIGVCVCLPFDPRTFLVLKLRRFSCKILQLCFLRRLWTCLTFRQPRCLRSRLHRQLFLRPLLCSCLQLLRPMRSPVSCLPPRAPHLSPLSRPRAGLCVRLLRRHLLQIQPRDAQDLHH